MIILVPTDFSDCANDAFNTACDLAPKLNAEVHLFHVAEIAESWKKSPSLEKIRAEVDKEIVLTARDRLATLQSLAQSKGLVCHIHYEAGDFLLKLEEITELLAVDLLIMGSHGSSGKKDWRWGANTQKVVRKVKNNVLFISERTEPIALKKVVFASDLNVEDQEAFRYFLHFIKDLNIEKIHVLAINTPGFFGQPSIVMKEALKEFKKIAYQYDCDTHFYQNSSVDAGIRDFSNNNGIDLIAISNRQRHPIIRIFQGSNIEVLVSHTHLPVLSIDYPDD